MYLEKIINATAFALDEPISAKPAKIVSGQEPEKTNELFQGIAKVHQLLIEFSFSCNLDALFH